MTDIRALKQALKANPRLYEGMKKYIEDKLYLSLVKMISCEDSSRLHFLRGISHSYMIFLHDFFEEPLHKSTEVKV